MREEIAVLDEQIDALDAEAEDLRVRAVVSETPLAVKEHSEASRHAHLAHRARTSAFEQLRNLELQRDALLEKISAEVA